MALSKLTNARRQRLADWQAAVANMEVFEIPQGYNITTNDKYDRFTGYLKEWVFSTLKETSIKNYSLNLSKYMDDDPYDLYFADFNLEVDPEKKNEWWKNAMDVGRGKRGVENKLTKIKAITVGGADRQQSAHRAFLKISDDTRYVAVHDAARCLITPEQITRVAVEAFSCGAAIAACKAKDTVKLVENDRIKETPDRETVWQAQTPQIMKTDLYRACIYTALEDGFVGTDDASLCERHGFEVRVVDTGYENIKITTPIDLLIAESVIRQRESEENAK